MNLLVSSQENLINFWESDAWGFITIIAVLVCSLIVANVLKKSVKFLEKSLIPTSVLGGMILLIISFVYTVIKGQNPDGTWENIFNLDFFGGNGLRALYVIAYHGLAIGFIASTFKPQTGKFNRKRTAEVFNTGVTTVATYLLQGVLGMGITILLGTFVMKDLFKASGLILPFGYGQGTGQALNWGTAWENRTQAPIFEGGANFGLTVAALGFLSASIGGVIHLNIMKKKGRLKDINVESTAVDASQILAKNETPFVESIDKMSIQFGFVFGTYVIAYVLMWALSKAIPSMTPTIYGFNFLFGVLGAVLVKNILKGLKKCGAVKKEYINGFLMDRICGFAFDLMIVAGFAAIELQLLVDYWHVLLIMGVVGAVSTYFYNAFVAKKLFPSYADEQFMAMYGMLTGTASTGMMLLREVDDGTSLSQENLVYQNLPAIVFGFPIMLLAAIAPEKPLEVCLILLGFFVVLNIILFRNFIFKRKKK